MLFRGPGKIALGLASPVFITSLIMYVSGVPMLEEQHDQKYGDDPRCAPCISHKSLVVLNCCGSLMPWLMIPSFLSGNGTTQKESGGLLNAYVSSMPASIVCLRVCLRPW